MNKKLLFGIMSLAALAACSTDDFEGQQQVAEGTSPIQFEVINNSESMRASMGGADGNKVVWNADDGDLFTLYHGAASGAVTGYQNATYKAQRGEAGTPATLTTPSMILPGSAIMVWPVDTTFRYQAAPYANTISIAIPVEQGGKDENGKEIIQNQIPYVSDLINIGAYAPYSETATPPAIPTAYNTAGKDRKYPVFMRPMASQLILNVDYAGTYSTIEALESGDDGITPIKVTSMELRTTAGGGTTNFTKEIPLQFNATAGVNWGSVPNNAWSHQTQYDVAGIAAGITANDGQTDMLTTYCLNGNNGAKFLMLPQDMTPMGAGTGVADAAVVVNTIYGKVVVAPNGVHGSQYDTGGGTAEIANAWYRYVSGAGTSEDGETNSGTPEASGDFAGKYKVTSAPAFGLKQTINTFSTFTAGKAQASSGVAKGEQVGVAAYRFVKVLLTHLDMSGLHIKDDKQLRDAARVWQAMGLEDVTVFLDGDANHEFKMSQKTIKVINDINASIAGGTKSFKVKPCKITTPNDESCTNIVITGAAEIPTLQDIAFIENNAGTKCNVVLNEGETWKWDVDATTKIGSVKVQKTAVTRFINKGTLVSDVDATLKTLDKDGSQNNVPLRNDGTWNVTGGKLFVQFTTTNNGGATLNISSGAEYRQDGGGHIFYNWASNKPLRFGGDDKMIGVVNNYGVFATVNNGVINNYGLIEHRIAAAKTYITTNQTTGASFKNQFSNTSGSENKMGRINLDYSNKDEDNISVSGAAAQGFISVTVDGQVTGELNTSAVGTYVNYMIINSGVTTISTLPAQIKYVEIADKENTEIAWSLPTATPTASYLGLMVLSPVNIKLGTEIKIWDGTTAGTGACYLGADMYVGGTFNNGAAALPSWNGYYGNTTSSFATKYVTY